MKTASASGSSLGFDPAQLIADYQLGVWRYLRSLGCDTSQADDLTQETFLAVLRKPFDDYNPAATAAYLRKVAYSLLISSQRRTRRMVLVEHVEEIDQVWERWTDSGGPGDRSEELIETLRGCLGKLTDRARLALQLRFRQRLPREQIAQQLGITEHGAKNLMQRAKKQLRQCIESKLVP